MCYNNIELKFKAKGQTQVIKFVEVIEKIEVPIKKIRGITNTGEYAEIRLKDNVLDVRVSKEEGNQLRVIFKQAVLGHLSIDEIIEFLDVEFIKED